MYLNNKYMKFPLAILSLLLLSSLAPLFAAGDAGSTPSASASTDELVMKVEPIPRVTVVKSEQVVVASPIPASGERREGEVVAVVAADTTTVPQTGDPTTGLFTGTSTLLYLLVAMALVVVIAAYVHMPDKEYRK